MAKAVIKEGYTPFSFYIKKDYLKKIREEATKDERTLSSVINKFIGKGIEVMKDKNGN